MIRSTAKVALTGLFALGSAMISGVSFEHGLVFSEAQAVIGRPLTPLSYAGVARRTTRRVIRRSAVYAATLPRGCATVVISGTSLYQCGGTYYQAAGNRYVIVEVD